MTHEANGPTVSLEEAQRIERETAEHLLKTRRLSLIVDLDQTMVHATVDPTVGEWMAEGRAWEEKQKERNSHTPPPEGDSEEECNPNWEALKDVKEFRLGPETFGGSFQGKAQNKSIEADGCMYYIKPRCGASKATGARYLRSLDPDGRSFCGTWRQNMKCMSTPWAPGLMPKKCVQLSTPIKRSSEDDY